MPSDTEMELDFEGEIIGFKLKTYKNKGDEFMKIIQPSCINAIEEIIIQELILSGERKDSLIRFVDVAKEYCEDQIKESKKSSKKTIKVYMWRKDFWNLLFKSPKRPIDTLYLKKGQKECLLEEV